MSSFNEEGFGTSESFNGFPLLLSSAFISYELIRVPIISSNDKRFPRILRYWWNLGLRYLSWVLLLFVRREWFRIIRELLWVILWLLELIRDIFLLLICILLECSLILLFQVRLYWVILLKNLIVFFLILIYYSHLFWVLFLSLRISSNSFSHSFLFLLMSVSMFSLV